MQVREGYPSDIEEVFSKLWGRGRDELLRYGFERQSHALAEFLKFPPDYRHALCTDDGEVVAVYGAIPGDNGIYETWFMATERFPDIAFSATRYLRRFIAEATSDPKIKGVHITSGVSHPMVPKWFKTLGFHPTRQDGVFHHYEYTALTKNKK